MVEREVLFEEAQSGDAAQLVDFLAQVTAETDLISQTAPALTEAEMINFLLKQAENQKAICLLAKLDSQVIGTLNVVAYQKNDSWLGDLFLVVGQAYRGYGIGQTLLEMALDWAETMQTLDSLVLTVQVRNKRALHIYQKFGFNIDSLQPSALVGKENNTLDVYTMSRSIK
ncbi:GNAT family N-acetyltransferase [Streptococcus tangpeifui]|uniref:GNAT family N-acetyltransferase n=1 Tax=Streptococcus tangpeifui TaxID=2709400 RepID=UPI0013EA6CDD|nr:GNAT family N-acetyltransferase [Streptococcus sp. ZJ373]